MRPHLLVAALLLAHACSPRHGSGARPPGVVITVHGRRDLVESSAAAMSVDQAGILFTINDSGNEPLLFALDTIGAERGAWRVEGATNVDWEAASIGGCGRRARPAAATVAGDSAAHCVYIGDTGDNDARRAVLRLYRVPEPRAERPGGGSTGGLRAEGLVFRYADGAHDVEAMYVAPDESIYLISKRPLRDGTGRLRPALLFRIAPDAWERPDTAVAELVDSLPIVPGSAPARQITDAALSPDARYLAVRTYAEIFVFATDSATGRLRPELQPAVCETSGVDQIVGEGVTWMSGSRRLLLTAEGRDASMWVIECPLPHPEPQGAPGGSAGRDEG